MDETTDAGRDARTTLDESASDKLAHLTAFQRDLLHALRREGPSKGLTVKRVVGDYYGEEINHGRLYPNLDDLVTEGLVAKRERDGRTNEYELTDAGEHALVEREEWVAAGTEAGA
ncbi:helix-turn-helix transcriptional regulator [Halarchaeum sp. P4]|uniref:helix-turn-helix transcriptional regulator n=1 Tax=Halarchaeum sp. P4 TaxID=3421639 RepID=UPI003EBFA6B8